MTTKLSQYFHYLYTQEYVASFKLLLAIKMKKIGLFLDSEPGGGTFQYNLSILGACKYLSTNDYEIIITYSSDFWYKYLKSETLDKLRIDRTIFSRAWFQARKPISTWRKLCTAIDSFSKTFVKQNCDLWIFPSQDIWSYSLPIPTLGTIHDLMHRYERHFPEVGSSTQYQSRERHYQRMCIHSKAVLVDSEIGKQQTVESYHPNPDKIYVLPFVPPSYIHQFDESVNIFSIYNIPDKYIFYPAQFWEHKIIKR